MQNGFRLYNKAATKFSEVHYLNGVISVRFWNNRSSDDGYSSLYLLDESHGKKLTSYKCPIALFKYALKHAIEPIHLTRQGYPIEHHLEIEPPHNDSKSLAPCPVPAPAAVTSGSQGQGIQITGSEQTHQSDSASNTRPNDSPIRCHWDTLLDDRNQGTIFNALQHYINHHQRLLLNVYDNADEDELKNIIQDIKSLKSMFKDPLHHIYLDYGASS